MAQAPQAPPGDGPEVPAPARMYDPLVIAHSPGLLAAPATDGQIPPISVRVAEEMHGGAGRRP